MDPITGAVVAAVAWFIFAAVGYVVIYLLGALIGAALDKEEVAGLFIGAVIGWIGGAAWAIFAIIQAILQIVHLVQLL